MSTRILLFLILVSLLVYGYNRSIDKELAKIYAYDAALSRFSMELAKMPDSSENNVLSPLSAAIVLTIASNGAKAGTQLAFRNVLGPRINERNMYYANIQKSLQNDLRFNLTNAVFINGDAKIKGGFRKIAESTFNSHIESLPFDDPESVERINRWVSDKTNGMIRQMFGGLRSDLVLILLNTIHFKSDWETQFDTDLTVQDNFYADKNTVTATFMQNTGYYDTYKSGSFQTVFVPYAGGRFEMVLILPNQGVTAADVMGILDTDMLKNMDDMRISTEIKLIMPKFTIESEFDLTKPIAAMGLAPAMERTADFGSMSAIKPLFISQIVQKAKIEVSEEGTEAAAATAVIMRTTSIRLEEPPSVVFDRPFIFFIWDKEMKLLIFVGNVANPS